MSEIVDNVMGRVDELYRKLTIEYNDAPIERRRVMVGDAFEHHPTGRTSERLRMRAFCQAMVEMVEGRYAGKPEHGSRFVVEYDHEDD